MVFPFILLALLPLVTVCGSERAGLQPRQGAGLQLRQGAGQGAGLQPRLLSRLARPEVKVNIR